MRKPEQTTEPSIEEILASIRRIIADEGSPTAPVFGQAVPDLAADQHQDQHYDPRYDEREESHYDPRRDSRYDNRHHDERHDHRFDDERERERQYLERGPYREQEPDHQEREPRSARHQRFEGAHHREPAPHEPQFRDYGRELPRPDQRHDARAEYRHCEDSADYDFESGAHSDFGTSEHSAGDFDRREDHDRRAEARNGYQLDDRASNNFDPYATHDDFENKSARVSTGNEDEILELTEDFMVVETAAAPISADSGNGIVAPATLDYADLAKSLAETNIDQTFGSEIFGERDETAVFEPGPEPELAPIVAPLAPVSEDTFSAEGLDSVLSNVVAEMQRLSEGKGLTSLLESSAMSAHSDDTPASASAPNEGAPQPPQSWQPPARQTSAPPAQRPVWSARRLDGDGGNAQQTATPPLSNQSRERSRNTLTPAAADGSFGAPPFGETLGKPAAQEEKSETRAPTALARNAGLKSEVEEIMPDFLDGDFPPESGDSGTAQPQSKVTVAAIAAARATRKPELVTPEETPELPDAEEDTAVKAESAAQKVEPQPQAVAPATPSSATENAQPQTAPIAAQVQAAEPIITAPVSPAPVSLTEKLASVSMPDGLEDGVREILKPLIADWLKDNLPRLVEEAIREEIRKDSSLTKVSAKRG